MLQRAADRCAEGEPVAYVTGRADFRGLRLRVDGRVLIPRPETEEVVQHVLDGHGQHPLRVLDIGTGSGCIALALKAERPEWSVVALDDSEDALDVARANGRHLGLDIDWRWANFFDPDSLPDGPFDIIVTNPPYIPPDEIRHMDPSTLRFEPPMALFTDDDLGLICYDAILHSTPDLLAAGGSITFELGFKTPVVALTSWAERLGLTDIRVHPDMAGHQRIWSARDSREGPRETP